MAKFKVEIDCNNAAFDGDPGQELAHILREVADRVDAGIAQARSTYFTVPVRDTNGNTVGKYTFTK